MKNINLLSKKFKSKRPSKKKDTVNKLICYKTKLNTKGKTYKIYRVKLTHLILT